MKIVFHDTETTGIEAEDRILQSAYAVFEMDLIGNITLKKFKEEIIKPPIPCKPEAAAVHGIWKTDYENAPTWEESESKKDLEELKNGGCIYVAHNAFFDLVMLEKEGLVWPMDKVIDTLNVAKHFFKDREEISKSSLQYLRYAFDFDSSPEFKAFTLQFGIDKLQAHTALSDIIVLAYLFKIFLQDKSYQDVYELSKKPFLTDKVFFGQVFDREKPLKEAVSETYEQYGKVKRGIDYFNWAFYNMEHLDFFAKLSISNAVMEAIKEKSISINDQAAKPMLLTAHAFLPQHWDVTEQVYNEDLREKVQQRALSNAESKSDLIEKKHIEFVLSNLPSKPN